LRVSEARRGLYLTNFLAKYSLRVSNPPDDEVKFREGAKKRKREKKKNQKKKRSRMVLAQHLLVSVKKVEREAEWQDLVVAEGI